MEIMRWCLPAQKTRFDFTFWGVTLFEMAFKMHYSE